MKKFLFLLAFFATPAAAEKLSLDAISDYLNGLSTAEAPFTQINYDGSTSAGKLFLKRPGRIRFEYTPPNDALVVVGGGQVAVFDEKSNHGPTRFPLSQTPLRIILERNVDLAERDAVVAHESDGRYTRITAQDPRRPELGYLQLVFSANPIQLEQWIVVDESNTQTVVVIDDWTEGQKISNRQFNIMAEMRSRGFETN